MIKVTYKPIIAIAFSVVSAIRRLLQNVLSTMQQMLYIPQ
jgi:hypothetical protein